MWKSINVGLVAAVVAGSTAVAGKPIDSKAHPPGVGQTAKNVADRDPAVRYAQATREQRSTSSSQIFYNIVADGGAACNGDVVTVTRSIEHWQGSARTLRFRRHIQQRRCRQGHCCSGCGKRWRQTVCPHRILHERAERDAGPRCGDRALGSIERYLLRDGRCAKVHGVQQMGACKPGQRNKSC